jgi:hypothetical protein
VIPRHIEPELLDELPPDDPSAVRSRRDLVRLNAWMGHSSLMARALEEHESVPFLREGEPEPMRNGGGLHSVPATRPRRIVELGAGDGRFLLRVARRLSGEWRGTTAVLVDRHSVVDRGTESAFEELGWGVQVIGADVFEWLSRPTVGFCDWVIANLFLHHFPDARLTTLLAEAARLARAFVALEPRRAAWPLTCSHLVWMIGCNRVTQNDAPASVRAGFSGDELSRLWPADGRWSLREQRAGWCSHVFKARRNEPRG